jgi:hypothetical protein
MSSFPKIGTLFANKDCENIFDPKAVIYQYRGVDSDSFDDGSDEECWCFKDINSGYLLYLPTTLTIEEYGLEML